jgi:hypothetical protein
MLIKSRKLPQIQVDSIIKVQLQKSRRRKNGELTEAWPAMVERRR